MIMVRFPNGYKLIPNMGKKFEIPPKKPNRNPKIIYRT
jgi:hypothetical protein